ncbi:hypothetical protein ACX3O0_01825 [Homoserinimonas sp. A447]
MNVRLVEKASQGFTDTPNTVLAFSPMLSAEKWLVEIQWTPDGGTGDCSLVAHGTVQTIAPGWTQVVDLTSNNDIRLRCQSSSSTLGYSIKDARMLALRVTG